MTKVRRTGRIFIQTSSMADGDLVFSGLQARGAGAKEEGNANQRESGLRLALIAGDAVVTRSAVAVGFGRKILADATDILGMLQPGTPPRVLASTYSLSRF